MGKKRMYEPYGYREENFYVSKVTQLDNELAENKKNDEKEFQDISQLISDVSYNQDDSTMVFKNLSGETLSVFNIEDIIASKLIKQAYYDAETKEIVIVFEDDDVVRIDVSDIVSVVGAGDGLESVTKPGESGGTKEYFNVKIDGTSESDYSGQSFITVGADGVKVNGIKDAIESKVDEEASAREAADQAIMNLVSACSATLSAGTDHIYVEIVQDNGKLTALTVNENGLVSVDELQQEADERKAADDAINERIDEIIASGITADLEERVQRLEELAEKYQVAIQLVGDEIFLNGRVYLEVEGADECLNDITRGLTNETY